MSGQDGARNSSPQNLIRLNSSNNRPPLGILDIEMHGGSDDELLNPSRRQNPRQVIAPARQLIRTDELPEDIDESNEVESNDEDFPDVKSDEEDDDDS